MTAEMNEKPFETLQEVFELGIRRLLKQGCGTKLSAGKCLYRTEEGTACLIGLLIPDNAWNESFNNEPINNILPGSNYYHNLPTSWKTWVEAQPVFTRKNGTALREIQMIHDFYMSSEGIFLENVKIVAKAFELDTSFLEEAEVRHLINTFDFN